MNDSPRLLGIVLCGGKSSRMGRNKSLLPHPDGTSYLLHAVQRIAPLCELLGISCHDPSDTEHHLMDTEHHLIGDPVPYRGPAVGIAASLKFARHSDCQACMFTPVDMPKLTTSDLLKVKQAWQKSNRLTVAQADQLQPLVAVYPVTLLDEVEALADSDDRSLMNWMKSQDYATVAISAAACRNVNSSEDLSDGT